MKMLYVEANAEELQANRTVMDTLSTVLNNFAGSLVGARTFNPSTVTTTLLNNEKNEDYCEDDDAFGFN